MACDGGLAEILVVEGGKVSADADVIDIGGLHFADVCDEAVQVFRIGEDRVGRGIALLQRAQKLLDRLGHGAFGAASRRRDSRGRGATSPLFMVFLLDAWPQLRAWVQFMDRLQSIERQMGIDLRGRNIGVAEDRLHRTEVRSTFHHVGSATVA